MDLSRGRWIYKLNKNNSSVPFLMNLIVKDPDITEHAYYLGGAGNEHVIGIKIGNGFEHLTENVIMDDINFKGHGENFDLSFFDVNTWDQITFNVYGEGEFKLVNFKPSDREEERDLSYLRDLAVDFLENKLELAKIYNFQYKAGYTNY